MDLNCFVVPIACIYELIQLWNIKIERFEMHQSCFYCIFMLISTAKILNKGLVYIVSSEISTFSAPKITYFIPFLPYNRSFSNLISFLYEYYNPQGILRQSEDNVENISVLNWNGSSLRSIKFGGGCYRKSRTTLIIPYNRKIELFGIF